MDFKGEIVNLDDFSIVGRNEEEIEDSRIEVGGTGVNNAGKSGVLNEVGAEVEDNEGNAFFKNEIQGLSETEEID